MKDSFYLIIIYSIDCVEIAKMSISMTAPANFLFYNECYKIEKLISISKLKIFKKLCHLSV